MTVKAGYSKHRRQDILPIRPNTTIILRDFLQGKMPDVRVFNMPSENYVVHMFKADLADVSIAYRDEAGRYADFHALRHTTGSLLAAGGVHPKVAQAIMRHSDINLTMSRYTHSYRESEVQAIKSLPDFSLPSKEAQEAKATGTDGQKNSAIYLAKPCGKQRILANASEQIAAKTTSSQNAENMDITTKKRVFGAKTQTEERGFEPLVPFGTTVFKTATISHSVTPPSLYITRSYVFAIVPDFQLIPTHFIRFWRVLQEDLRAIIRVNFRPNAQVFCKKLKVFANF